MHYDWKWQLFENAGICMEKLVKPHWSNLFSVGFTYLKPPCHRPCDQPCASRLLRTSAAAASTAAGASVSCAALAPVLSRLYALNLLESKYKQNYWRIFQEITFCIWNTSGKFFLMCFLCCPCTPVVTCLLKSPLRTQFTRIKIQTKLHMYWKFFQEITEKKSS